MLLDYLVKVYQNMFNTKVIPSALRFRLYNIKAQNIIYSDFIQYFGLKNAAEALYFILDDNNLEEIMRYSLRILSDERQIYYYPPHKKPRGYNFDSEKEHRDIDKEMDKEEKEYLGKK